MKCKALSLAIDKIVKEYNNWCGIIMFISCSQYPIPLVIKNILTDSFNGELLIKGDNLSKSLYFQDGDLIFAKSDIFVERIEGILYQLGKITEHQYDYIKALDHSEDLGVGRVMVQNNFISEEDLQYAMLYQMRKIAINAFAIQNVSWDLKERETDIFLEQTFRIPLPTIIADGARKIEDISFFLKKIRFLSPKTTTIPKPITKLMVSEEIALYRRIQDCQKMSNPEIIAKLNLEPDFYWKKLVLFILLDIIDFYELKIDYDISEDIRNLIEFQKKLEKGDLNYFEILGVSQSATRAEIKVAFLRLSKIFNPERFGSAVAPEIKNIARYVYVELENAYQILKKKSKESKIDKEKKDIEEIIALDEMDFRANLQEDIEIKLENEVDAEGQEAEESDELEIQMDIQEEMPLVVLESEPKTPFERAEELYEEKKYPEATKILKAVIKSAPKNGDYYCLLGMCQAHMESFRDEAERHLRKAIELMPWSSDPVFALGVLFRIQGKKKQAAKCFEQVVSMITDHGRAVKAMRELAVRKKEKSSLFSFLKKDTKIK